MSKPKHLKHVGQNLPHELKGTRGQHHFQPVQRTFNKPVVGAGHQGNSNLPIIREVDMSQDAMFQMLIAGGMQSGTKKYRMGRVSILVSPPDERYPTMGWHMSISHPERYPTWDEVASAWYQLVPDADHRVGVMILPKREDYISIHNYCFQVHEQLEQTKT